MSAGFRILASWFALSLGIASCSTPQTTGYLADYAHLEKGRFIEMYFADRSSIAKGHYNRLVLGSISTDAIRDQKNVSRSESVRWLRNSLLLSPEASADPVVLSKPGAGATAQLDLGITEMNPGSAAARILAGEFGAGHAWVQVEGRVTDPQGGATLATFAERRRSSGATGFRDVGGDSGPALIEELIEEIGADIRRELGNTFGLR